MSGAGVELRVPTLDDVRDASERIAPHLRPTPLLAHGALSELVGTEVLVKHENHLPTGAVTSVLGVPFFIAILIGQKQRAALWGRG